MSVTVKVTISEIRHVFKSLIGAREMLQQLRMFTGHRKDTPTHK